LAVAGQGALQKVLGRLRKFRKSPYTAKLDAVDVAVSEEGSQIDMRD
jgi:hypothetical protein